MDDPGLDGMAYEFILLVSLRIEKLAILKQLLFLKCQNISDMVEARVYLFSYLMVSLLVELLALVELFKLELSLLNFD